MPTHQEIEDIAERAADKAIRSVFTTIGIDVSKPIEAQQDFHRLRELSKQAADPEFRKDLEHMRIWRLRTEQMTSKGMMTVVAMTIGGAMTVMWVGIQNLLPR